jgi:hypothetical protein
MTNQFEGEEIIMVEGEQHIRTTPTKIGELVKRRMVDQRPIAGLGRNQIQPPSEYEDVLAYLSGNYLIRQNTQTKHYYNWHKQRSVRSKSEATAFAKEKESGQTGYEWVRVVEST